MRTYAWLLVGALGALGACKERATAVDSAPPAATTPSSASPSAPGGAACKAKLDAINAVRHGVHPCSQSGDCTVWIGGAFWNGCPTEVSVANAKKLDTLRAEYEAAGCPVEYNAACAPQRIVGCQNGTCGGS